MTWLAIVCPARAALRLAAVGRYLRGGHKEKETGAEASVTVALTTTASIPVAGSPARPATVTSAVRSRPGRAPSGGWRLSNRRVGATGTKRPTSPGATLLPVNQPTMSMTRWPPDWENTETLPLASGAITWLAIVEPLPTTLRLLAVGRAAFVGKTVQKPLVVLSVTVTFNAAAVASEGSPAMDPTARSICSPAASAPKWLEDGSRVSRRRVGPRGMNRPACAESVGV